MSIPEHHPILSPLNRRSIYLAGPIDGCTHAEMWDWRLDASAMLAPMHCFNPCKRTFDVTGGSDALMSKEVVTLDKAEIAASDGVLVWYNQPAGGSMMTGTTMEILYAFERGKLVVLVTDRPGVSPWIDYHTHARFSALGPACKFIQHFYDK
jgi:nucleoside 2-deoxyribosyltransferase